MADRINEYIDYHIKSSIATDIDPQVEALQFISNAEHLTIEQRYWISFLFSTCYCVGTCYIMFKAFPDFRSVNLNVLDCWWNANRSKLIFQTDRRWVRSRNQFVKVVESYIEFVNKYSKTGSQSEAVMSSISGNGTNEDRYDRFLKRFNVFQFGRFAMFLYTDLLCNVCGVPLAARLDIRAADSVRNGLAFAMGRDDLYTGRQTRHVRESLNKEEIEVLNRGLRDIANRLSGTNIKHRHKTIWSIETCLCAYRKFKEDRRRWVGYYAERYAKENDKLKEMNPGVSLKTLYEFSESLKV